MCNASYITWVENMEIKKIHTQIGNIDMRDN